MSQIQNTVQNTQLVLSPSFDYSTIPEGYYHDVMNRGFSVRRAWHLQKFQRVIDLLADRPTGSLLDVGCFAGSFLSLVPESRFSRQLGVDILPNQIAFAKKHFGTSFRDFSAIQSLGYIAELDGEFDVVTCIEVIEHLTTQQILQLFQAVSKKLKPGGNFILSTPNYTSAWPLIEILLNHLSEVQYEEQHITKFNYFNVEKKLRTIYPELDKNFNVEVKTTTHFISPFLAVFGVDFARKVSSLFPHRSWNFPFGNLVFLSLTRKS